MKSVIVSIIITLVAFTTSVSAAGVIVSDVVAPEILPGSDALVTIGIENTFEYDVEDVSFSLDLRTLPLSIIGSSESTLEEIEEDEVEDLNFRIRAAPTAKPGDYQVPFTLTYRNVNSTQTKTGTIGIRVKGTVELITSLSLETPVMGRSDRLLVKIINKGFADARYVTVRLTPKDMAVTSDEIVYIGDIGANDFETAAFDVRYFKEKPIAQVVIDYRDFNNLPQTLTLEEQLTIYSLEEAEKRGIIEEGKTGIYLLAVGLLILIWASWRIVRKRQRMRKSMQSTARVR